MFGDPTVWLSELLSYSEFIESGLGELAFVDK